MHKGFLIFSDGLENERYRSLWMVLRKIIKVKISSNVKKGS